MRLSAKSMALACGLLWGSALLFAGLIKLVKPTQGVAFLEVLNLVYP